MGEYSFWNRLVVENGKVFAFGGGSLVLFKGFQAAVELI